MGKTVRAIPRENEIYKHFKGSLYQIVTIAVHTETSDKLVVYRSIENPERVFARPLEMFMSEVDRIRHPFVKAKYRFTLMVEAEDDFIDEVSEAEDEQKSGEKSDAVEEKVAECAESDSDKTEEALEAVEDSDDTAIYKADGELVLDPLVEAVLDEKEFSDKIASFEKLRNKCTPDMLTAIAISLDIQLSSDSVEENYAQILKTLKMHNKYESSRLRN